MPALFRLLVAAALTLAACGGGGGDGGGGAVDAAPSSLTVHYHRALSDYDGWLLEPAGGAGIAAGSTDGFGAVYTVPLSPGATSATFSFSNGAATDGAGALAADLGGGVREVWVISGWPKVIPRALPALPSAGKVAVYYLRGDASYDGWGLHLWGERVRETTWAMPQAYAGVDPEYGAGFLVDLTTGQPAGNCPAGRVCVIVHSGDTKDPGPDMSFDPAVTGDLVFIVSGSTEITPAPREVGEPGIAGMAAHLVSARTLAWCCRADPLVVSAELRWSRTAGITAAEGEVTGGEVIPLARRLSGLTNDELALAPYLQSGSVWDVPEAHRATLAEAVKGQMVVVGRDEGGALVRATLVNTSLYLDERFAYDGPLGATISPGAIRFDVWAPTAQAMKLRVFDEAKVEIAGSPFPMTAGEGGVWSYTGAPPAWKNHYYQYEITVYHPAAGTVADYRVTDPWSANLSANGRHSQIVDLADPALEPPGWDALTKPPLAAPEDIVLYELHVRDFSASDPTTLSERRGKYLGFVPAPGGEPSAGLAHLRALAEAGLTHVHLLPAFDIATVDEDPANRVDLDDPFSRLCARNGAVPPALCAMFPTQTVREAMASFPGDSDQPQRIAGYLRNLDSFNWGYDPLHYGAPEGSFASTADGTARIREFRQMVMGLSELGLRVVMDVVYNHTNAAGIGERSVLDRLVPGYYHRLDPESGFVLTSSCCANTASEHAMMRRLLVDTAVRWARDYKVDGFRFDLMGLHLRRDLLEVKAALGPDVYVYGEGWDMGEMAGNARGPNASQRNMAGTGIGTFNDRLRDGARGGGPFDGGNDLRRNQGFVTGIVVDPNELAPEPQVARERHGYYTDLIKIGMAGGLAEFRLLLANGATQAAAALSYGGSQSAGYTRDPQETINYVSAHDNQVLWDIVQHKLPTGTPTADRVRAVNLAHDLVLLGQGVPFLHAGDDLLRSKAMDKNSYDSGDWFNLVDWSGQRTAWRTGLPPEGENAGAYALIRAAFADATATPGPTHIAAASAHVKELLRLRRSSPLFRLREGADVRARVDFLNGGPEQVPGLIVMTLADGTCAGPDLDAARDGLIVVVNADRDAVTFTVPGAAGARLHPIQAASADPVVREASVSGADVTVPARTTAVFEVPQSAGRAGGPPCNTR
jgi:pullulanase